jgi:hypothetical protein
MNRRLVEIPALARRPGHIPAECYNLWLRARRRLSLPWRFEPPGLTRLVLECARDSWVCLERHETEVPVLAWTDFEEHARAGIHAPVACQVLYYHYAASRLRARLLEALGAELARRLGRGRPSRDDLSSP